MASALLSTILSIHPALVLLGIAIILLLARFFRKSSIRVLPGPTDGRSLLGFEREFETSKPDTQDSLFQWHTQYGTAYRIPGLLWSDILVVSDPRALQYILHSSGYGYRKPDDLRYFSIAAAGRGILYSEGKSHARQRKILNPAFSVTQLKEFLVFFQRSTTQLLDRLDERVGQGTERLDISHWAAQLALDAVGEATFGHNFGALDGHTDDLFKANERAMRVFSDISLRTLLARAIRRHIPVELTARFSNIVPSNDAIMIRGAGSMRRIAAGDILAKAKQEAEGYDLNTRKDILSVLVKCNNAAEPKKRMSDEEVLSQTASIIQAGHHVTGAFMAWLFYELAHHPEDQQKIYEEIQAFRAKNGYDVEFTVADYESMAYLNAFLKENLRYHAVVSLLIREATYDDLIPLATPVVSPNTGETITHVPVQKGQRIILDFASYNRLRDVWGEDAYEWNPSRFLDPNSKRTQYNVGMYSNILTFSGGAQGCIGFRFGLIEAQTIIVGILERFILMAPPEGLHIQGVRSGLMMPMVAGKWGEGMQVPLMLKRREQ
ncbi:hypothetical protein VNI00_016369 [Paramarasmius palmivorus]|uniref:Cytochrome P450 n=1 Tax=Paramarasmius palmivorus TaxID=297713 RepID=A0AAW0BGR7_9AGAR